MVGPEAVMREAARPSSTELRNFGLVTAGLVAGVFGLALPWLRHQAFHRWPWILSGALILPALLWPPALRYVHWLWVRIGLILGWINSRIILTILFFVVILPLGLVMRALGHDPVARKLDPQAPTYRVPSRKRTRESMERPF
jgi:F0F1-type ATP synthase assembly protein I